MKEKNSCNESEIGKRISKQLFPSFEVIDADSTYFYARKEEVGAIEGHLDEHGNATRFVVEKFGKVSKLFWGKNAVKRIKKYLNEST